MRKLIRRLSGVVAGIAIASVLAPATSHAEEAVFSGGCLLTLGVSFSPFVGRVPGQGSLAFSGSGPCVVNGELATATFQGTLQADPGVGFGCASGLARGEGRFSLPLPDFPDPVVQVAAVNSGGVVTLVAYALTVRYEGVAEFVPDSAFEVSCAASTSVSSATWTGPLLFQDPDPPPVR